MDEPRAVNPSSSPTAPEAPRYRGPDRRRGPTPMLSRFSFLGGRRRGGRRDGEQEGMFVDLYSPRLASLLLLFFSLTVFDSVATVVYLRKGGIEMNPIAQFLLDQGEVQFVAYKGLLTGICAMFVLLHKNFRYARTAIAVGFAFYFALAIYHIVLQVQAWHIAPSALAAGAH